MSQIVQYLNELKEKDRLITNLFDNISTIISLREVQLNNLIVITQANAANIEARLKKTLMKYVKLLDYLEQYKEEDEARSMVDLDYQIINKHFIELRMKLDSVLNVQKLSESDRAAVGILKGYKEV